MSDVSVKLSDAAIRRRQLSEFWFYFSRNKGAVVGLAIFLLMVFTAIFADWLAPHNPTLQYRDALLLPPAWQEGGAIQSAKIAVSTISMKMNRPATAPLLRLK